MEKMVNDSLTKQNKLNGIIVPVVTPLKDQDTLDTEGVERLVTRLMNGGVHGLFILGTTGEGPALSYRLRYELTERVCDQAGGRLPVLVGITDTSLEESIRLAEKAEALGADAVVAAPPYYFTAAQPELKHYFETLADRCPLPVFLYNMPSHTKVEIEAGTVADLSRHPNIIGLKDSSANLIYFQKVLRQVADNPEFLMFTGPEEILMHTVLSGGDGGVSGGANIFPELYVAMYNAAAARDEERMQSLQKSIIRISATLYSVGSSPGSYLQGVKSALSLKGICSDTLALPYRSHSARQKEVIQQALEDLEETWRV